MAAHRARLIGDGVARLHRLVNRLLDTRGVELFRASGVPGAAIIVRLPDGVRIERYWGVADGATQTAMHEHAVFQMMSISKPVSAFCIVRLAERGLLDLHVPVSRYLGSWTVPAERRGGHDFDDVTLHRLLSHSAGFNLHMLGWSPHADRRPTPQQLLDGVTGPEHGLRIVHAPGTQVEYSGAGFALAEMAAVNVTGLPWHQIVQDNVLEPLGMRHSCYSPEPRVLELMATRHDAEGRPMPPALLASGSGSGLYATAADICTFWEAFLCEDRRARGTSDQSRVCRVVSPAAARMMTTVQNRGLPGKKVGLGFYLWEKRSDTEFGHRGYKDGWWSVAEGLRRRRCVIVGCSNGDAGERCIKPLTGEVRQLLFDQAL
ncbi:MAG: beta-lactamase family protein [Pyrinomonadaceae bacterium]|nr:beta-lactamase family protein [Phycisphaerales bacterium]